MSSMSPIAPSQGAMGDMGAMVPAGLRQGR
jgi:hypothetical protein